MKQSATIGGRGQALIASIVGAACATALLSGLSSRRPGPVEPLSVAGVIVAFTVCVLLIGAVTEVLKAIRVLQPVQTILGTALGAVAWIILLDARHPDARFLGAINDQWVVCAAVLLATPLVTLVVTAAHEAGHALAGRAVGLRVDAIAFGPVIARRTGGHLRLRRYGRMTGSGGFVRCTQDGATPCWWRRATVAAGGPAADVLVVVGALVVDAWFRVRGLQPMPAQVAVVIGTSVVGASAAVNAARFVLGSPDRNLIGRALKHRRPATAQVHPSQIAAHDGPVADLDSWEVLWQLRRALAYRDPNSARAFCDRLYSLSPASSAAHTEDALLELAYVRARLGESDMAETLIADACSFGVVSPAREYRARAALMLARGDMASASDAATLGLDQLTLDGGDTLHERELLLELRVAAADPDFAAAWLRWEKF